jgi:Protein of unknown function (DUF2892)
MFRRNVGGLDRVLRVTLGTVFLVTGLLLLTVNSTVGIIVTLLGVVGLVTGIVGFCGLYIPFGISTARPAGHGMNRMCNCEAWMKDMQNMCGTTEPSASSDKQASEAETTTHAARGVQTRDGAR